MTLIKNNNYPSSILILSYLKQKYSNSDLSIPLKEIINILDKKEEFPLYIINKKLTVLESVVKYLREEKNYSLHKISELLNRDEKNLWHAYHNARKKFPLSFDIVNSIYIPLNIFSNNLSPLESLVFYLKQTHSLHKIAVILNRDDRTIWTTYDRAKRKHEKK